MNGYRFYLEYDNKTEKQKATVKNVGNHSGNVLAIYTQYLPQSIEGIGAILYIPNSPVGSTGASWEYIREKCKRVPEIVARQIHPELFKVIDSN
jgi:hypothetical protein